MSLSDCHHLALRPDQRHGRCLRPRKCVLASVHLHSRIPIRRRFPRLRPIQNPVVGSWALAQVSAQLGLLALRNWVIGMQAIAFVTWSSFIQCLRPFVAQGHLPLFSVRISSDRIFYIVSLSNAFELT